jgi:Leu/Phe-tRNA-protein transferase
MDAAKKKMNQIIIETSKINLAESVNFVVAQVYEIMDAKLMNDNYAKMYSVITNNFIDVIRKDLKNEIRILKMLLEVLALYFEKPPIHFNICQN